MDFSEPWEFNGERYTDSRGMTWSPAHVASIFRIFDRKAKRNQNVLPLTEEEQAEFAQVAHPSEARIVRFYQLYCTFTSRQLRQLLGDNRPTHLRSVD